MKKSEKLADLVLAIPIQAKANPRWIGWDELERLANKIKNFNILPDYELIIPERLSMRDILFDFRLAIMTKTIEARIDALELLDSQREKGEVIVLFYHPMTSHGLSTVTLVVVATPIQVVDFLAVDYIEAPK
jgi:hypothetical protein